MKNGISVMVIGILIALLAGCTPLEELDLSLEEKEDYIKIGISMDSYVTERWLKDRDVFVATAQELGAQVNTQVANGNIAEQQEQIHYFIEEKMDVIVIIPIDSDALSKEIALAKEEGIGVIAYDRMIQNAEIDIHISFDNEMVGRLMAEALIEAHPEGGEIIAINGPKMDANVQLVEKGFLETLEGTSFVVAYTDYCENWIGEQAVEILEDGLEQTNHLVAVMCGNDDLASQVVVALSENRMLEGVSIVSQDADLIACQNIVEGTQTMTVFKDITQLAKLGAEYAIALGNDQEIHTEQLVHNGFIDVPVVYLEPVAITKRNMNEIIIKGGFHYKEDVYLYTNQ